MSDANAPELAAEDGLEQDPAAANEAPLPGDLGEGELPGDPAVGDEGEQAADSGMPAREEGLPLDEGAAPPEEGLVAEPGEDVIPLTGDAGEGLPDEPVEGLGEAVPAEAGEEGEGFQPAAEELGGEAALDPGSLGEEVIAQDGMGDGMGDDAELLGAGEEAAAEPGVQEGGEEAAAMGQEDGQGDVMAAVDGDGAYPEAGDMAAAEYLEGGEIPAEYPGEMAAAEYLEGGEIPAEYPGEMAAAEYLEGGEVPPAEYVEGGAVAAEYLEGGELPAEYAGAGELQEGPVDDEQYQQQLPHPYYPTAPQGDDEQAPLEQDEYGQGALGQPAAAELGDEHAQLEEQRRALEEENAVLLAEQAAITEQEQQQEQYQGQYEEPAAYEQHPEEPAYEGGYITSAAEDPYQGGYAANAEQQVEDAYPGGYASHQQELPPPQPAIDIDALLAEEREKHEQQLKMETRAREELEDMILRIEKHFKAEQAARKKAEELLQQAIAAEMDAKNKLEDVMKKRGQEQRLLDEERNAIKRERHALESMRQEFENELQAARTEVAKAQEALAGSEERIRSAEQVERARLEAEYQSKLSSMQGEMDRMRDEMTYRTMVMQDEMENWRQQAQITANAVLEAKSEVMERKRELDSTKEKMDRLLDKLLMGRERGIELSGAIASNQRMLGYLPGMGYGMGGMPGQISLPPMGQQLPSIGLSKMPPAMPGPQGPWMNNMMGGGGNVMMGGAGGNMMGGNMMGGNMMGGNMNMMGGGGSNMMGAPGGSQYQQQNGMAPSGKSKLPPLANGGMNGSWSAGSWAPEGSPGPQPRRASSVDNAPDYAADEQYAPVQSRFAQNAAEVGLAAKAKQRSMAKNNNNRSKKADRFEEAEKEAKRNAAMSKWN